MGFLLGDAMGVMLGAIDGIPLGSSVGINGDGSMDNVVVGRQEEGMFDGTAVREVVGVADDLNDGDIVGIYVGEAIGFLEGRLLGETLLGFAVGNEVVCIVGE